MTTHAPTTEASTTDAMTTDSQTTESSTIDASTTEASTTYVPTTGASSTVAPTTEGSTTEASTTPASTTYLPTTEESTTEVPTTHVSTTDARTTPASTTEASTTDSLTTDTLTTEASTTDISTTEESTTDLPKSAASTTDATTTKVSTTNAPTIEASTTDAQTTEASTPAEATTESSTTNAPNTVKSTTESQTTEASTTDEATTVSSTTETTTTPASTRDAPTTESLTTEALTTETLTTDTQTKHALTTEASTTVALTTISQTKEASTTDASTTEASTTDSPTTESSTTNSPTTDASTDTPTTEASTTDAPTTEASNTDMQRTEASTIDAPTTPTSTTYAPTTAASTIDAPTTALIIDTPTKIASTTQTSTTDAPTTTFPSTNVPITETSYLLPYGESKRHRSLRNDEYVMKTDSSHLDFVSNTFIPPNGFPFGTEFFPELYFTENGVFFFQQIGDVITTNAHPNLDSSLDFVAPFWADGDLGDDGDVYFETFSSSNAEDSEMINMVAEHINNSAQAIDNINFRPTWMLIATWTDIHQRPYENNTQQTNTFQGVLATDGTYSFVLFNYENDGMNWNGMTESPADAIMGFNVNANTVFSLLLHPNGTDSSTLTRPPSLTVNEQYRPNEFIGNTNQFGRWVLRLEANSETTVNPLQRCRDWYDDEPSPDTWDSERLTTCPCTFWQARVDGRFTWAPSISLNSSGWGRGPYVDAFLLSNYYDPEYLQTVLSSSEPGTVCFQSVIRRNDAGVRCCYNGNRLIEGYHDVLASSFVQRTQFGFGRWANIYDYYDNLLGDLFPRYECCSASNDRSFCDLYYEKRPPASCTNYRPTRTSWFWGDPHLTTMDEYRYTFNGKGEYICSNVDDGHFTLLGRMSDPLSGPPKATIFSAFAAIHSLETETVVQFTMWENGTGFDILVNGTEDVRVDDLVDGHYNNANDSSFSLFINMENLTSGSDRVFASWSSGINIGVAVAQQMLDVVLQFPQSYTGRTRGLFGIWNGDISDDLCFRNETCLNPTQGNLTERQQFDVGNSWRVQADESFFTYIPGYSYDDINDLEFEPIFTDELIRGADNVFLKNVENVCGSSKECIYDALVTENLEIGINTKETNDVFQEDEIVLGLYPPNITDIIDTSPIAVLNGSGQIFVKLGQQVILQVVASAADPTSSVTYSLGTVIEGASIDPTSGEFVWTPNNTDIVSVNVIVSDGTLTSSISLEVRLCPCVNGECDYNTLLSGFDIVDDMFSLVYCICPSAWSGIDCSEDYDACFDDPCHPGVTCKDNVAPDEGNTCGSCPSGLIGDGFKCYDYDECATMMDRDEDQPFCEHEELCTNTLGSYVCACRSGFDLHPNGKHCLEIDECDQQTDNCDAVNAVCNNTVGAFTCICNEGFSGDGTQCIDIDECSLLMCGANTDCMNTVGSFVCTCQNGFIGDGSTCQDINECELKTDDCQQICINTEGSYMCNCSEGFQLDSNQISCNAIEMCTEGSCTNADCYLDGQPHCLCLNGYIEDLTDNTTCTDIDECSNSTLNLCDESVGSCNNTQGGYTCSCNEGYKLENDQRTCIDIDECIVNSNCSANADCVNTDSSYFCECHSGFSSLSGDDCIDINECQDDSNDCDDSASCLNAQGSFTCACNAGYISKDGGNARIGTCVDYDECLYNLDNCEETATCSNTIGSFNCTCNSGYTGDGLMCQDINECMQAPNPCPENENRQCVNFQGSHECPCNDDAFEENGNCIAVETRMLRVVFTDLLGWEVNSFFHLLNFEQAMNDIADDMNVYFENTELSEIFLETVTKSFTNVSGGVETMFVVKFRQGSKISDERLLRVFLENLTGRDNDFVEPYNRVSLAETANTLPVDPCEASTDNCSERLFTNCVYIENGNYECNTCIDGYELTFTNDTCIDIDECATNIDDCGGSNEHCINVNGSYACECQSGYSRDINDICTDINECDDTPCTGVNEVCTNLVGSYRCDCQSGYVSVNGLCEDVNECTTSSSICNGQSEVCTNLHGGYICECEPTLIRVNGVCSVGRSFRGQIRVIEVNQSAELAEWDEALLDETTDKYQSYATQMCIIINNIYLESLETTSTFYECSIIGFSEGSIIAVYEMLFYVNSTDTAESLLNILLYETDIEDRLYSTDSTRSVRIDPSETSVQEFPIVCEDDYCKNGGVCQIDELYDLSCSCSDGYSGNMCEIKESSSDTVLWVLFVAFATLLVLVLLASCCVLFILQRRKIRRRQQTVKNTPSWPSVRYPAIIWNPARNRSTASDSSSYTEGWATGESEDGHMTQVARAINAMSSRFNNLRPDMQNDAESTSSSQFIRPYFATGMEAAEQHSAYDDHVPFSYLDNSRASQFSGFQNRGFRHNDARNDADDDSDHSYYVNW